MPYFQTTPADWWVSQAGPLYNTHQRCAGSCPFDTSNSGSNPNEHLYYELPYYTYAVVIDANTPNSATGVRPDGGSAYFLHVTVGAADAGLRVDRRVRPGELAGLADAQRAPTHPHRCGLNQRALNA